MPEILAPVGGKEQLIAAVRSGADAVYLGASGFNARMKAENFGGESLENAVKYCHVRGVKTYVTFNTLINGKELKNACETAYEIAESGADAVIVQDFAAAEIVKKICPDLKLHASTQMTVTNADGVKYLENLGFERVVLARELSFEEIKEISQTTKAEIEVFVHGALCMSVSGACYLSSVIGGRSGNRGMCAQPCRLNFKYGKNEYALSLKDMSYIEKLSDLEKAGVKSFKIEGRMKRPEYVAAAVDACRKVLDGEKPDMKLLKDIFSRDGFTDGYFTGKRTKEMFGHRQREDVIATASNLGKATSIFRAERQNVAVSGVLKIKQNQPTEYTLDDGKNKVTASGNIPENTDDRALAESYLKECLNKMGGTPFYLENIKIICDEKCYLKRSDINSLRREATEKLIKNRSKKSKRETKNPEEIFFEITPHTFEKKPGIYLRFENAEQYFECEKAQAVILTSKTVLKTPELIKKIGNKLICELPVLCFQTDVTDLKKTLEALKKLGVTRVYCENICVMAAAENEGFSISGGCGLNITNTVSLEKYREYGLDEATLSFELSGGEMSHIGGELRRGIIAYGYLPLMRLRACPAKINGCEKCGGNSFLTDRLNKKFPLFCNEKKFSTLLNCVPLFTSGKRLPQADYYTLYFTKETREEARKITEKFLKGEQADFEHTGIKQKK